jgi:hypothetical protein
MNPGTVTEAGLWVQGGDFFATTSFFDSNGALIQSITSTTVDFFAGLHADQGIASIRVGSPGFSTADALQFTAVPEASALVLALTGLALAAPRARRP